MDNQTRITLNNQILVSKQQKRNGKQTAAHTLWYGMKENLTYRLSKLLVYLLTVRKQNHE